jgi:predicted phosphodiesterase
MKGQWHGGKGPTSRVNDIKAWNKSPLWDNVGPNKKKKNVEENAPYTFYTMVLVVGDLHGGFTRFKERIIKEDFRDCIIIQVGDYGIGFKRKIGDEIELQSKLNEVLAERNIQLYVIRGNHDNPDYFNGDWRITCLSNIEFLPDYTVKTINGKKFLFVGGGISIDRKYRVEGVDYWPDERFYLDESKVVECDVLITHSAPSWLGPNRKDGIATWCVNDKTLWEECVMERKLHDKLFDLAKPKKSFHGHFHRTERRVTEECASYILNELEFMECICDDVRMRI